MGKGNGEHPPQKFIGDQFFCQMFIFVFMGVGITLSSLSTGMDDGGSFPYPYLFTGFVLGPILLVNFISRWYVVRVVQKKGVTRKNILKVLNDTTCGKHIWPWSCKVGMLWCIPGSILTGLGGVNCGIEENHDNATNDTPAIKNTCYYDIEGVHAEMYKGLAIGLVVIHVFSFVYLLLSNCPVHNVLEQIKEDPKRTTAANNCSAVTPAPVAAAPATNTAQASATGGSSQETEMITKIQQLENRIREIESRDRQARELSVLPPPPTYNELMTSDSFKSSGAHPDNTFA